MIRFACPHCDASMKADEQFAGKLIACKQCGRQLTIPPAEPPPRLAVPAAVPEPQTASEAEPVAAAYGEPPPVRRPVGAEAVATTNGDQPPQPLPMEMAQEFAPAATTSTTEYQPPGRQFGFLSTLCGLAGAALFAAGAFYPLFLVKGQELQFAEGWRVWLVQSGGILLGIVSLYLVFWRRYAGLWVLGPGSLLALGATFGLLFTRLQEEKGMDTALSLRPGQGLLMLLGGAALLTLAAFFAPRRKRYENHG